jgi:hypothetical protein
MLQAAAGASGYRSGLHRAHSILQNCVCIQLSEGMALDRTRAAEQVLIVALVYGRTGLCVQGSTGARIKKAGYYAVDATVSL